MKILHINCNYTGSNAVHRTMKKKFSKFNINICIFAPTYKKEDYSDDKDVIVSKCINKRDRYVFYYKSHKIKKALEKKVNVKEYDLMHAFTLFTDGNVAYNLKKKYGIPYVVAIRDTDVNTFFKKIVFLRKRGVRILLGASAICFLSSSYKKQVFEKYIPQKYHNELSKKVQIIPNGINDFWIENKYAKTRNINIKDTIKIIYVGRITANKNLETTQKALETLRNKGYKVEFSIVGDIVEKQVFDKVMRYPNTTYYEAMPKEKLINMYRENDIFVMPSFTETFGLVYVEAMSQGLPIIYTRNQGFDSCFDDGAVGYAVDASNFEEIAEKIIQITNNYQRISKSCVDSFSVFNWDAICQRYYDLYSSILNKK